MLSKIPCSLLVLSLGFVAQACVGLDGEDPPEEEVESPALTGASDDSRQDIESHGAGSEDVEVLAEAPNCRLYADPPRVDFDYENNRWTFLGEAARLDCVQHRPTILVKVRKDIFGPDEDVAAKYWSGINGYFWARGPCSGQSGTYFTEISTNAGGKGLSERVYLDCPN